MCMPAGFAMPKPHDIHAGVMKDRMTRVRHGSSTMESKSAWVRAAVSRTSTPPFNRSALRVLPGF